MRRRSTRKAMLGVAILLAAALALVRGTRSPHGPNPSRSHAPGPWPSRRNPSAVDPSAAASRSPEGRSGGPEGTSVAEGAAVTVAHVVDGDTVYLRGADGALVKGRISAINAPECHKEHASAGNGLRSSRCIADDEYFGLAAYRELESILASGPVTLACERRGDGACRTETYGRVLIQLAVNQQSVGEEMVRRGAAWAYTKYRSPAQRALCRIEQEARTARRGMWADEGKMLQGMSNKTRRWYRKHGQACDLSE